MKKSKQICIIFSVILVAVMSACTHTAEKSDGQEVSSMDDNQILTLEYVIENTELTAADFEGIDFTEFVKDCSLTKENIGDYYLPRLLQMYRRQLEDKYIDYSDIYDAPSGQLTEDDLDKLQVLVWEYHDGNNNSYMVIDYEAKSIYYSQNNILSACRETDKVAELTEQAEDFVKTTLLDSDIFKWENSYKGFDDTTESWGWSIGIELRDDRCIVYSGSGNTNSNTPIQLHKMLIALKKEFVK